MLLLCAGGSYFHLQQELVEDYRGTHEHGQPHEKTGKDICRMMDSAIYSGIADERNQQAEKYCHHISDCFIGAVPPKQIDKYAIAEHAVH